MEQVVARPRLKTAGDVMASLDPPKRECTPVNGPSEDARAGLRRRLKALTSRSRWRS
jgi:hypothetical protein